MNAPERARGGSARSPLRDEAAIEAVLHQLIGRPVGDPQMLICGDHDVVRTPDSGPLRKELPVLVEDLDPTVVGIGDVDAPVPIDVYGMWKVELAWSSAFDAPRFDEPAGPVESDDSRIGVTVRHEEAAVGQPGDVGGQV